MLILLLNRHFNIKIVYQNGIYAYEIAHGLVTVISLNRHSISKMMIQKK